MRAVAFRLLIALTVAAGLLGGAPAQAQDAAQDAASPADRAAIRAVIEQQLQAFQRDDGEAAFAFASPGIRAQFGTSQNFMRMVEEGYAPVYRPREVTFGSLDQVAGRLVQRVLLVGPDGRLAVANYVMEQQADGSWKIAACYLTQPADTST